MKLLGIDYGRRRIGVAVADSGIARGLCVIDRNKFPDSIAELLRIINEEKPAAAVFGLPLNIDDEETDMSREVREFAAAIERHTEAKIHFIDESYTSKKAAELMMYRKKKARRDKSLPDRIAACLILQEYIDSHILTSPLNYPAV
ncbi:MAG: Holliday junction resolvase RuvX [Chitinispirillales bacterium]|jgi:putative Holliday junction resolvase|nr:Holliday junction resolvase RuvX [Chitinispirillales bacterium]